MRPYPHAVRLCLFALLTGAVLAPAIAASQAAKAQNAAPPTPARTRERRSMRSTSGPVANVVTSAISTITANRRSSRDITIISRGATRFPTNSGVCERP